MTTRSATTTGEPGGFMQTLRYLTPYERRRTSFGVLAAAVLVALLGILAVNLDLASANLLLLVFVVLLALLAAFMALLVRSEEKPAEESLLYEPPSATGGTTVVRRPGTAGGSRRVNLRCRKCGGNINALVTPNLASITCPSCGTTGPPPPM